MSDVQTHMRVQDAIEAAILDRGVEPPADLADIVFAAARAALESAPSSLRAELAEARAEIARLTVERDRLTPCGRYLGHGEQCDYPRAESAELCGFHLTEDNVKLHRRMGQLNSESEAIGEKADEAWRALNAQKPIVEAAIALVPEWTALDYDVRCTVYGDRPELVEKADALVAAVEEGQKA